MSWNEMYKIIFNVNQNYSYRWFTLKERTDNAGLVGTSITVNGRAMNQTSLKSQWKKNDVRCRDILGIAANCIHKVRFLFSDGRLQKQRIKWQRLWNGIREVSCAWLKKHLKHKLFLVYKISRNRWIWNEGY